MSHELRTPLTVLAGFLETLRDMPDDALPAEQRAQYLDMMHEQAQRMQAIVEDLLTLSTLESSPGGDPRAVNIGALLQKARQQIEALSGGRHKLEWHVDESLDVLGAETELTSALSNLLTNAVRYTPDGGTITVRWEREDDGGAHQRAGHRHRHPGPPHPRLTERFYRVDRGRSRAVGGTGLGLAITKHIAMRHDAELLISSEPGKGSTFAALPARTDRGGRQRSISRRAAPRARAGWYIPAMRILVIEDEPKLADYLKRACRSKATSWTWPATAWTAAISRCRATTTSSSWTSCCPAWTASRSWPRCASTRTRPSSC